MNHIYAVCAYKESPYLRECIRSLKEQTVASPIILCAAVPSEFLTGVAEEFGLPLYIRNGQPGIAEDWNYAMDCAAQTGAEYVTLCHQDDVYLPGYGEGLARAVQEDPDTLLYFTDYGERRDEGDVTRSTLLNIKRLLLWRMRIHSWQTSRLMKHRTLSLGQPICCPAVTYHITAMKLPVFTPGFRSNLDWQAFERLSLLPGRFRYDRQPGMLHRIHSGSTTSAVLRDNGRTAEDLAMFRLFWPRPLAALITRVYRLSEKSNS